ncbi:MAG: TRAP transporter small permease subunit [Alphaproteobacteria bacterium]|nr:TRAP transporter small permease subunit [Alphaproteobacteria bacterium]
MYTLDRIITWFDRFIVGVGKVAAWLGLFLMLVIMFDVISRAQDISIVSSTKLQELEWHLHGALFLLCLGFAYLKDAHVRIEVLRDRFSPRTRVWIEMFGSLLFVIPYSAIVVYWGYEFAEIAFRLGEESAQSGLSDRWIIKAMIPVGFLLLLMSGLTVTMKCIIFLFGPEELKAHAEFIAQTHHADMVEAGESPLDRNPTPPSEHDDYGGTR